MSQLTFMMMVTVWATLAGVLAVGTAVLIGRGSGSSRLTLRRAAAAAAITVAAGMIAGPLLLVSGVNLFGAIHLLYVGLVVVLPLAAGILLVLERLPVAGFRLTAVVRALAIILLITGPMAGIYATFIEPRRLIMEYVPVSIPSSRTGSAAVKIGVLADIQANAIGTHEQGAVDALLAESPDIILIPGDLLQGWPRQLAAAAPALRQLLARLRAPAGIYYARGNCETLAQARTLLHGLDITILDNAVVRSQVRDRQLMIGGLGLDCTGALARQAIRRLEEECGDGAIRLLVAHRPDALLVMQPGSPESPIDLLVAGHTHGGQVRVPLVGPLITLSRVPRRIAAGGLHVDGGRRIYVSRGLGCERGQAPRIRFLCPPEATLITLTDESDVADER